MFLSHSIRFSPHTQINMSHVHSIHLSKLLKLTRFSNLSWIERKVFFFFENGNYPVQLITFKPCYSWKFCLITVIFLIQYNAIQYNIRSTVCHSMISLTFCIWVPYYTSGLHKDLLLYILYSYIWCPLLDLVKICTKLTSRELHTIVGH